MTTMDDEKDEKSGERVYLRPDMSKTDWEKLSPEEKREHAAKVAAQLVAHVKRHRKGA